MNTIDFLYSRGYGLHFPYVDDFEPGVVSTINKGRNKSGKTLKLF